MKKIRTALKKMNDCMYKYRQRHYQRIFLVNSLLKIFADILVIISGGRVSIVFGLLYTIIGIFWLLSLYLMLFKGDSNDLY